MTAKRHYKEFDVLRCLALFLILACHFTRGHAEFNLLDLPLGAVGNLIFFAMSGWLLGLGWISKNCPMYGWPFIRHRLLRLMVPLWLFAIPWMIYLSHRGIPIHIKDVVLNLFLLNWFDRIQGMTPYWFITAIAVFYIIVACVTHIPSLKRGRLSVAICLSLVLSGLQIALSLLGIRFGYILIMVAVALICYLCGEKLYDVVRKLRHWWVCACAALILFFILWWIFHEQYVITGTPGCYWSALPVAALISIAVVSAKWRGGGCGFLSSISYEIYLVHSAMLGVVHSFVPNMFFCAVVWLLVSILLGWILHILSCRVFQLMKGKA